MCIGAVAGALARLAELRGDLDHAIDLYEAAIEREESVGARIWAVNHRRRLAEALIGRGARERSEALLAQVTKEAPAMGLIHLAERARAGSSPQGATPIHWWDVRSS